MKTKKNIIFWNTLAWSKISRFVQLIQNFIFKCSTLRIKNLLNYFQSKLILSLDAKLIALRRILLEFIDNLSYSFVAHFFYLEKNLFLIKSLNSIYMQGCYHIFVSTSISHKLRLIFIPTIMDRAIQALVFMSLEPLWETKFAVSCFGFNSYRYSYNAINFISTCLKKGFNIGKNHRNYILNITLIDYFDCLDYSYIIWKLGSTQIITSKVQSWLCIYIKEKIRFSSKNLHMYNFKHISFYNNGIIFPLLLNISLQGIERYLVSWIKIFSIYYFGKNLKLYPFNLIQYSNSFIIIHNFFYVICKAEHIINLWLRKTSNLQINKRKKHIFDCIQGFDFLGSYFTTNISSSLNFRLRKYPSIQNLKLFLIVIRHLFNKLKIVPITSLILKYRLILFAWVYYFFSSESKKSLSSIYRKINGLIMSLILKFKYNRNFSLSIYRLQKFNNICINPILYKLPHLYLITFIPNTGSYSFYNSLNFYQTRKLIRLGYFTFWYKLVLKNIKN